MSEHPIQGIMDSTMQKIKEMVDVNTIVGDPMSTPDGATIIPISKVSFGFVSGGSDLNTKQEIYLSNLRWKLFDMRVGARNELIRIKNI